MKVARFEPPLLIADVVMQALVAAMLWTLWIFSTRTVADGALLLSASLDVVLLRHHWRIKGWRYSQAAMEVCDFCFRVHAAVCCVYCDGEQGAGA